MAAYDAEAQVTATNTYISHMQTQADAAIAKLTDQATTWSMTTLSAVANLALTSLSAASGAKPSLLTPTLPTYVAADLTAIVAPTLPAVPSLAAGTSPMWSETFWTNLKSRITSFVTEIGDSDDVDTAVNKLSTETTKMQSALYAKEYERKTQTLRDLYSGAEAATGAKGFTYPNSMTVALKMDAQQKFQFDMHQTSRDLITHIFEWAKSNWQFSIQQGVQAHNVDVEFNIRYLDTTLRAYEAQVNALLGKYREDIAAVVGKADTKIREFAAQYDHELEKHKTLKEIQLKEAGFDLSVAKTNADITTEDMRTRIADFQARVANFLETEKANMQILNENVKNRVAAASAAAQAAAAMASAAGSITVNTNGA